MDIDDGIMYEVDRDTELAAEMVTRLMLAVQPNLDAGLAYPIIIDVLLDEDAMAHLPDYTEALQECLKSGKKPDSNAVH